MFLTVELGGSGSVPTKMSRIRNAGNMHLVRIPLKIAPLGELGGEGPAGEGGARAGEGRVRLLGDHLVGPPPAGAQEEGLCQCAAQFCACARTEVAAK
jgi:hypothetical protein